MSKVKVLWSGITGRTGKEALEIAKASDSVEIVAGICRSDSNFYNYDEYKYTFEVTGDLDYFEGEETISKNNEKVYVLKCHGGLIKR